MGALCIWLLKNLRIDGQYKEGCKPVLRVWHAIVLGMCAIVPGVGLTTGIIVLVIIGLSYAIEEGVIWKKEGSGRIASFLNRTIE